MRNKRIVIAIVTATVLLMTGFVFADTFTNQEGYENDGFFGHMRGFGWSDEARQDRDEESREDSENDGFFGHMRGFAWSDEAWEDRDEESREEFENNRSFGHMRGFGWSDEAREDRGEESREGSENDGFFGHMRGFGWSEEAKDFDWGEFSEEGSGFGQFDPCCFGVDNSEDVDFDEQRENWLAERFEAIDKGVEAGEISEEDAKELKETLEERSMEFEEEGSFRRGPGMGRRGGGGW